MTKPDGKPIISPFPVSKLTKICSGWGQRTCDRGCGMLYRHLTISVINRNLALYLPSIAGVLLDSSCQNQIKSSLWKSERAKYDTQFYYGFNIDM